MKKQFKAQANKLMDMMINSIYTQKEIFLRELISNASDALDKKYYNDLKGDKEVNKEDYYIEIIPDKDKRTLTIRDTGIGMDETDLDENLGIIAKSATEEFNKNIENKDVSRLIGQFGVGFYSAFMVSEKIEVVSRKNDKAFKWESIDTNEYEITETTKEIPGTDVTVYLKDNDENYDYDKFLDENFLMNLVRKYSNYIKYKIFMEVSDYDDTGNLKEEKKREVLNSRQPLWKKDKSKLTKEDYENFYLSRHYGFDKPLSYLHIDVEGVVSFKAILYIPGENPLKLYTKDDTKGLELYSNGVKIMDNCEELIDDKFAFVKGIVDSEDISLNISRELLQHDRQLKFISKQINNRIRKHLLKLMEEERDNYEKFFNEYGIILKSAMYESYGMNKEDLQDLLLFTSKKHEKPISLKEYTNEMKEGQENIFYAAGSTREKIENQPALKARDEDEDVLYLTEKIDEFLIRMLKEYDKKTFKSILDEQKEEKDEEIPSKDQKLIDKIKENLPEDVVDVRFNEHLTDDPVVFSQRGDISIEMEKNLKDQTDMPIKAQKVLEIKKNSKIETLLNQYEEDDEKLKSFTNFILDQARVIEGLDLEDPAGFVRNIWQLID